mmetsp:Transcript_27894/g.50923  ORF Transcript_27894/g.50923 Transcript_27894/m.50923 type:complete len:1217 (+) Transcript_27894:121-3771(+)
MMMVASLLIPTILLVGSSNAAFLPGRSTANIGIDSISSSSSSRSSSQLFQTLPTIDSMKDQLSTLSDKLTSTSTASSSSSSSSSSPNNNNEWPSPPFDVNDPEALIAITKSFIATDFGIQSVQLPDYSTAPKTKDVDASSSSSSSTPLSAITAASASSSIFTSSSSSSGGGGGGLEFYSSSLLAESMIWISGNSLDDAGVLNKEEYLAAGRYFDLRKSFPDLEYRAHDFRIFVNEADDGADGADGEVDGGSGGEEITVRFTTAVTGTFRGGPLRLRSMVLEPNGGVMRCPPTSISITYSTSPGPNLGKITKLVTDAVLDRQIGNTNGLSGVPAAAYVGGAPPNALSDGGGLPPLVALTRLFGRPAVDARDESSSALPPFPSSVMIQLAKGVMASNFGLDDANLLAEEFEYVEPSLGPLGKQKYLEAFGAGGEFHVREGVLDLEYGLDNFRVDPYDPYRVWVDSRATGTRTGSIGPRPLPPNVASLPYSAPPEAISFAFDDDGFCTRLTAAAVLDPLLGNTGGLGGVYGLLYATGTPVNVLKTRSLNGILSRATKGLLSSVTGVGVDGWKLSDGRVVNGVNGSNGLRLPTKSTTESPVQAASSPKSLPPGTALTSSAMESNTATASKPFFAAEISPTPPEIAPPKTASTTTPKPPVAPIIPRTSKSTEASAASAASAPTATTASSTGNKAQQLKDAARAARAEAAEAKEKATAKKAQEQAARQAAIDAKLEAQRRAEESKKEALLAKEKNAVAKKEERERALAEGKKRQAAVVGVAAKKKQTKESTVASSDSSDGNASRAGNKTNNGGNNGGGMFSFLSGGNAPKKPPMAESVDKSVKKSPTAKPAKPAKPAPPAKRSPTISLFDSFKTASSTSVEKTKTTKQPTSKKVAAAPKAVAKGASSSSVVKRSPTISLFGTNSATPKKPSKGASSSSSSKDTKMKKTTASVFGIGGAPQSKKKPANNTPKATSSTKATPRKKSPTLNIFGMGGASSSSTEQSKQVSSKKSTSKPKSAPFFANKKATVAPAPAPAPIKRSPTISLFNMQPSKKKPSTTANANKSKPKEAATKKNKSPTFNLFGGSTGAAAPTKKQQPTQPSESGGNANPFSFFGSRSNNVGGNSEEKEGNGKSSSANKVSKTTQRKKKQPVKKSVVGPKGVPVLKQWKPVKGNSIEGRIYGSNSFKDGVSVTTSSIKGKEGSTKFVKGSVVQTKSGSKYFLD